VAFSNLLFRLHASKGVDMPFKHDLDQVKKIETMLRKEIDMNGRIMVRSLDKIHARTGLRYATISEIARRMEERDLHRAIA
jgi:hypothetical protein